MFQHACISVCYMSIWADFGANGSGDNGVTYSDIQIYGYFTSARRLRLSCRCFDNDPKDNDSKHM